VAVVVLSGCSEKQEANDTLPTAATSTPAETTPDLPPLGPKDLPMPAEARTQDAAGAEAFVRYYIELINRTSDVMDAQPLRDLSRACDGCDRISTETEEDASAGYKYEGGLITVAKLTPPLLAGTRAEMAMRIDQARLAVIDRGGAPIDDLSSDAFSDVNASAAAEWDPARMSWVMTSLSFGS
jgi:hypothetical protein